MPGWAQLSLENTATISWTYWASRLIINKNSKCFFLELPVSGVVSYAAVIINTYSSYYSQNFQFSSVQLLSHVRLFVTPWIAARQASLSITNFWSSPRLTSIESVMPSSHPSVVLFSCCPQSLPASESFPMSQIFAWGGQSIGVSASHQSFQWTPRTDLL